MKPHIFWNFFISKIWNISSVLFFISIFLLSKFWKWSCYLWAIN